MVGTATFAAEPGEGNEDEADEDALPGRADGDKAAEELELEVEAVDDKTGIPQIPPKLQLRLPSLLTQVTSLPEQTTCTREI